MSVELATEEGHVCIRSSRRTEKTRDKRKKEGEETYLHTASLDVETQPSERQEGKRKEKKYDLSIR